MKKLILISCVLLLTACTTVPVKQEFPILPKELSVQCKPLLLLEGPTTTLSNLMTVVAKNYALYHECAAQNAGFNEWYTKQQQIFNEANK